MPVADVAYIALCGGPDTIWWPPHVFHFSKGCAEQGGNGMQSTRVERYLIEEMNEYFPTIGLCRYCEMAAVYEQMTQEMHARLSGSEDDERCELCHEIDPTVVRTPSMDNMALCGTCWRTVRAEWQIDAEGEIAL